MVSTNWTRWEGGAGWQSTRDAYLQADLTPISARVAVYVREFPIQDFERVRRRQVLAQLRQRDYDSSSLSRLRDLKILIYKPKNCSKFPFSHLIIVGK